MPPDSREDYGALSREVEALKARLHSQESLSRDLTLLSRKAEPQPSGEDIRKPEAPFRTMWIVDERQDAGGTYTAGTDWNFNFDNAAGTFTRYQLPTAGGELHGLSLSTSFPARATLHWNSKSKRNISGYIAADNHSRIQVNMNGARQEFTADGAITLEVREGSNTLSVMSNGTPDRIELRIRLF